MGKNRIRKMPIEQFEDVMKNKWIPVKLEDGSIPSFLENIPKDRLNSIYASGDSIPGIVYCDKIIPSGDLIGGIDVYRNASDDPVNLNKDWYAVISMPNDKTRLLIRGPIKDHEHWINDIPDRLKGVKVLAVPKK